jgi:hypothetical protein
VSSSFWAPRVEDGTERILVPISSGSTPKKIVNVFALAIRAGLSARDLKDMVYAGSRRSCAHRDDESGRVLFDQATLKTLVDELGR